MRVVLSSGACSLEHFPIRLHEAGALVLNLFMISVVEPGSAAAESTQENHGGNRCRKVFGPGGSYPCSNQFFVKSNMEQ